MFPLPSGGEKLKFGDLVLAVASLAVIFSLIAFPLEAVFVLPFGLWAYDVAVFLNLFLSALIVGYIFADKIREARRQTITKITVLWAAFLMVLALIVPGGIADWGEMVKEEFLTANPGTTLSTAEWVNWEMMYLDSFTFLLVAITLLLSFVGLYMGSRLKKPK